MIIGAGPAGLSAGVYGASEGFNTLVVDQGGLGGQATSSSLIRNYLGFSRGVSGRRLSQNAYEQAWVFGAHFTFLQRVTDLQRDDGGLAVNLSDTGEVRARAVLLATGATYRRLGVPELESLNGAGVFYGGTASEASSMAGPPRLRGRRRELGGAGRAAPHPVRGARDARGARASHSPPGCRSTSCARWRRRRSSMSGSAPRSSAAGATDGSNIWCSGTRERPEETVDADGLFLMIGARPNTDWLPSEIQRDEDDFVLTGSDRPGRGAWPLDRARLPLETSMPGVFAAGDVRHGSVKRVASAVGEGSVAIQLLHQLFEVERLQPRGRPRSTPALTDR